MYTVSHYQGYDMPIDAELFESHEGEAREIIFQSFIDEGILTDTVYTMDDIEGDDIELITEDWITPFEMEQLKAIELYASESFWDTLTVESLIEALKHPTDEREVA